MALGGLVLIILYLFNIGEGFFVALIYGIPILIIGVVIFFNKNEDRIEQIKKMKSEKGGKK